MGDVTGWDFADNALNSTTQLLDRQKSAMNLEILQFNETKQTAFFLDHRNGEIISSLTICECRDFSFIGKSPRKKFTPCKHIYRIAIELGLMPNIHYDRKTTLAMMSTQEKKDEEARRIRKIERDPARWGLWSEKVHTTRSQQDRQFRAYDIFLHDGHPGYNATLESCSCPDFEERKIPCKHIYCMALIQGHKLKVTLEDFKAQEIDDLIDD